MNITGNVSLLDVAKTMPDSMSKAVIMHYALTSHALVAMPFETQPSGTKSWKMQTDLAYNSSTYAYRNLGSEHQTTKTPVQPYSANIKIAGGRVTIDRALLKMNRTDARIQRQGQIAAQARQITKDIFEGAGGSAIYGISNIIENDPLFRTQKVDMGSLSAGSVLTEDGLDEVISKVNVMPGSTVIYCTDAVNRRVKKLSRGNVSTGYNVNYRKEEFGMFSGMYDEIPVVAIKDGKGADILSTTDGDGSSSSLYVVTYGPEMLTGFQQSPMEVIEMSEVSVNEAFDLEWMMNIAPQHIRSIAKLRYIKNATS